MTSTKQLEELKKDIARHAKLKAARMAGPEHLTALQDQVEKLGSMRDGVRADLNTATKNAQGRSRSSAGYILLAKLEKEIRVRQRVVTRIMQDLPSTMSQRHARRAGDDLEILEKTVNRTRAEIRKEAQSFSQAAEIAGGASAAKQPHR